MKGGEVLKRNRNAIPGWPLARRGNCPGDRNGRLSAALGFLASSSVPASQRWDEGGARTREEKIAPKGSDPVPWSHICRAKAKPVGTLWPVPELVTATSKKRLPPRTVIDARARSIFA